MGYDIFSYKEYASCNFLGGDTNSFEIAISDKEKYNFQYSLESFDGEFLESKIYTISKRAIKNIKNIIEKNSEIFTVNSYLNNGSLDGAGQKFFFANSKHNREISAWNIDCSKENGSLIRKEYLTEYGDNLKQERIVLKVFYEITEVLKTEGIKLDLYTFEVDEEIELRRLQELEKILGNE